MKMLTSILFNVALAGLAFALTSTATYAAEAPRFTTVEKGNITKVDDRDRDQDRRERCERVRRECSERHNDRDREYRECIERERCQN
jgi:hypothetical protein